MSTQNGGLNNSIGDDFPETRPASLVYDSLGTPLQSYVNVMSGRYLDLLDDTLELCANASSVISQQIENGDF